MDNIRYSPSANAFYHAVISEGSIPGDATPITDEEHARLLNGQSEGLQIVAGDDGRPTLIERPARPFGDVRAEELARFRTQRELWLSRLTGIIVAAQWDVETEKAAAALALRRRLLDVPDAPRVLNASNLTELQIAIADQTEQAWLTVPTDFRNELEKIRG